MDDGAQPGIVVETGDDQTVQVERRAGALMVALQAGAGRTGVASHDLGGRPALCTPPFPVTFAMDAANGKDGFAEKLNDNIAEAHPLPLP